MLLGRTFLTFVQVGRARVKGDSGSKISFKTITATFANGARDDDEEEDENDDADSGKDRALHGRILQE